MNLKKWALELKDWKESGLTQLQWCALSGRNIHTFKAHIKEVKKELKRREKTAGIAEVSNELAIGAEKQPVFAELIIKEELTESKFSSVDIIVELAHAKVSITKAAEKEHIRTVLEVLRNV